MLLALAAGCGGGAGERAAAEPATPPCPPGDRVVHTAEDAEALAGCRVIDGDLALGPSLVLENAAPLAGLTEVRGRLEVAGNAALGGLFLPGLRRVGGDLVIDGNRALVTASLHALEEVAGDLSVTGNGSLERLDLGALRRVGGRLEVSGHPALEALVLGELSGAGALVLEDNPALPPEEAAVIERRLGR